MPRWIVLVAAFLAVFLAVALGSALLGGYLWFEGYGLPVSVRDRLPPAVARIVATATATPTATSTPTATATPTATPTPSFTPTATPTSTPTATQTPTPPPPTPTPEPLPGRLAIVGSDGNVYTMRPDGSEIVAVTANATPGARLYGQVAWSPGSARLAWTESVRSGRQITTSLLIALADGSGLQRTVAGGTPLAVNWSPDEQRVALLSVAAGISELRVVEGANLGRQARLLARGSGLYFTWAPDGSRLLAHGNDLTLSLLALDGRTTRLPGTPADFGTPAWSADGKRLVYALREGQSQRLVLAAPDGTVERRLAEYDGHAAFTLSPDGRRVAYISTLSALRLAALGPLYVVGDEAGAPEQVVAGHVLAAFWSPDGSRLLALAIESASPSDDFSEATNGGQLEGLWLRWHVWDGKELTALARFLPTGNMLVELLAHYDQQDRAITPWSPDGNAFAFAVVSSRDEESIWVQRIDGSPAQRVAAGSTVSWSRR